MVSQDLIKAIKLASEKNYVIAHKAGIHPSTLSKIINGIERVKRGDERVLRIGRAVGLKEADLFE